MKPIVVSIVVAVIVSIVATLLLEHIRSNYINTDKNE